MTLGLKYEFLLVILLIAAAGDLLVPIIISTRYPGYNHLLDTISTLGTPGSPVRKYECINLIIIGILFIIFSIGQWLFFNQKIWAHHWFTIGIFIFGVGCIFAGLFPEDPAGAAETISGKIHGIASGLGFIFLILTPLFSIWISEFKDLKNINLILFILSILTFALFLLSENRNTGILKYTGLYQRINLLILYGSVIMNSFWMKRGF